MLVLLLDKLREAIAANPPNSQLQSGPEAFLPFVLGRLRPGVEQVN